VTTLTISLPDSLKDFIEREVRTKGYGNVSEYVRGLLRDAQAKEADARLETLLIEGLSSGKDIPVSPEFWRELRQDAARILSRRK
jgi:antitoxin ParD1/3/4